MLALKRRPGERINFYRQTADGVERIGSMMLVECNTQKAKLGFDFPESVIVVRAEIDEHAEMPAK